MNELTRIVFRNTRPPFDIVTNQKLEAELWRLIDRDNITHPQGQPLTPIADLYKTAVANLTAELNP